MSDTNIYKTVTFPPSASYAVVRALRARLETLTERRFFLNQSQESPHTREMLLAVEESIAGTVAALAAMGGAA